MKVLMFGWEFPPFNTGGLGTACHGLVQGLSNLSQKITLVLPKSAGPININFADVLIANDLYKDTKNVKFKKIDTMMAPYMTSQSYDEKMMKHSKLLQGNPSNYGLNIYEESERFADKAALIAENTDFDVIHCHDWMTFRAGIKAKKASNKPLVAHVHATEFDRTGGHVNQYIYDIEKEGLHAADKIIAVSNYTKNKIVNHYGISADKVSVVHNAINPAESARFIEDCKLKEHYKIVLFLGR